MQSKISNLFRTSRLALLSCAVSLSATSQTVTAPSALGLPPGASVVRLPGTAPTNSGARPQSEANQSVSADSTVVDHSRSEEKKPTDENLDRSRAIAQEKPTDFQLLAQGATGTLLPIFGQSLFGNVPSTFAPVDNVPVTPEYVLGPGDEIVLEVWGQTRFRGRYGVDRTGNISLPDVGSVHVAGLPFEKLQGYIRSQLERVYRNFDLTVNLGQLRSIQVFVLGNVNRPGSFTISSLSTLVNALFASGGPSTSGSMRHIQLRRSTGVVQEFDLYDLLLHGDKSKDLPLLPGDVIFVPPVGSQVAIAGSVKVPAIYELRDETSVSQILDLAGGLTLTAGPGGTRIERISGHIERSVVDVDLASGKEERVSPGDVLIVGAISERFNNAVTLRGNVLNPGRYVWRPGMRLHNLIPDKDALLTRDYYRAHNQLGLISGMDQASNPQGRLHANEGTPGSANNENGRTERAAAAASLNSTSTTGFTSRNDVVLSAADINWNYAVIERLDHSDLTTSLIPFNLGRLVLDNDPAENLELREGDVVTIFSKSDLEVASSQRTRFVRLEGEFASAGIYSVHPGETLRALIKRAGGLSSDAYLFGSEFRRESTRKLQQQRLNEYLDNLESEASEAASRVSQQGTQSTRALAITPAQIERLRGIRATGRIVFNMSPEAAGVESIPDIELEDGDRFVIPRTPGTVSVTGSVYNAASFLYVPREHMDRYLRMAGGPTRQADRGREFIVRADGSIISRQYHSGFFNDPFKAINLAPGDTVVVPTKTTIGDPMRTLLDIAQIVAQFGIGVAAINVLK